MENILANKLSAVIGRDNPKDVFDIVLIDRLYAVSWPEILTAAHQKAGFSNEDLVVRLKTFSREMLGDIRLAVPDFLTGFDDDIEGIIRKIIAC